MNPLGSPVKRSKGNKYGNVRDNEAMTGAKSPEELAEDVEKAAKRQEQLDIKIAGERSLKEHAEKVRQ